MTAPLDLALSYVAQGYPVFPCRHAETIDPGTGPYTSNINDLDFHRRPQHSLKCSNMSGVVALGKVKCANGTVQYKAYCPDCLRKGTNFPRSDIEGLDEARIPIIRDHDVVPCERCGSINGSEVHHWAPSHLFDDSDRWPTSHLCLRCHRLWHAMVTPHMSSSRRPTVQ
jgi:hypothetical protein